MEKDIALLVLGAFLALGGALLQSTMAWHQSRSDRSRDLLIEAYSLYLNGVAESASISNPNPDRTQQAMAKMTAGKQMMCAFAPASVVKALAGLEATSMNLFLPDAQKKMVDLVAAMRESSLAGKEDLGNEINDILFGAK